MMNFSNNTNSIIRYLDWKPKGYQPRGYEWTNYNISHNSLALAHDLFEHQIGESGTWTEEFRAFGASIRFDKHKSNFKGNNAMVYANHFSKMLKGEIIDPKYFTDVEGFNSDINYFTYYLMYFHNPRYLRNILMSGYNHAKNFSQEAFDRVADYNFTLAWNNGRDVEIDLMTGECRDIINTLTIKKIEKDTF